jgi:hypothetical protein
MAPSPFPFPKSSTPGSRPGEGEGRYLNCYSVTEGGRSYVRPAPGVTTSVTADKTGVRGLLSVNSDIYVVYTGSVVRISGGTVTTLTGSIPGSDGVTLARNNKVTGDTSTPDIVAVREGGGAYVLTSTAVSSYPDADLPATVNSVDFLGGYFVFSVPDGRLFATDLNTTAVNALSFATAEARADGLARIAVQGSLCYAFGASTIEPYQNVGTEPFPLQRGATVIPVGLLTTMAVAGYQEAWSGPVFFVASDKTVKALSGYETATVSTPDVDRFVAASTVNTLSVDVFVWQGRQFVAVSSNLGTWVYDMAEKAWHERSTGSSRWRAFRSLYHAGAWLFGDATSGNILALGGEPGSGLIQSGQLKAFPSRVATRLFADFTDAAMSIYVSWSHDGGATWSSELTRSIAAADKHPLSISNLGLSSHHGIIVRFRWAESVAFAFMGASADRLDVRMP